LEIVGEWRMQSKKWMDVKLVISSSQSTRHSPGWGVMMQTNVTEVASLQVVGEAMGLEIG
jgi:hypothetical protein